MSKRSTASTRGARMTARPVTTTDLWKLVGLLLVLIDHWGLLFADDPSWRVVGRAAARSSSSSSASPARAGCLGRGWFSVSCLRRSRVGPRALPRQLREEMALAGPGVTKAPAATRARYVESA